MNKFLEYLEITIGVILVAIGLEVFYVPHNLVTGGVSGLAIIILHFTENTAFPVPLWLTTIVLNLPMMLISYKLMGRGIFIKSLYTIIALTFALSLAEYIPPIFPDLTLSTIFGGAIVGIGTAMVVRRGATSGGTTLMAVLLQRFFKHFKVTSIMLCLDIIIILLGMFVFGTINTMYAIISIFVTIKVTDVVVSGLKSAKAAFILSTKSEEISTELLKSVYRGITAIPARGVYTGRTKDMLLCILSQKELVIAKEVVKSVDPNAFVIVTSVSEVLGEGFRPLDNKSIV
ncbi:MAG: YitT family protein [Defluviitaleaceae bacterium]|nr:YitT family protein [Defluviitaleaceae bacterium]